MADLAPRSKVRSLCLVVFIACLVIKGSIYTYANFKEADILFYRELANDYRRASSLSEKAEAETSHNAVTRAESDPQGATANRQFAMQYRLEARNDLHWAALASNRADRCEESYLRWIFRRDQRSRIRLPTLYPNHLIKDGDRAIIFLKKIDPSIAALLLLPAILLVRERAVTRDKRQLLQWRWLSAVTMAAAAVVILWGKYLVVFNPAKI